MHIPRQLLMAIAIMFFFAAVTDEARAQHDRNYFYLIGQAGATSYHGDLTSVNDEYSMFDLGISGGIGYTLSPVFSIRTEYRRGEYPRTERPNAAGYHRRHNAGLYTVFNMLPNAGVRPYFLLGASMTFFGTYDKGVQERDGSTHFEPAFGPVLGAGLDFVLSDRFSFFVESKWDFVTDDEAMDEISGDRGFDVLGYISGGLRWNLRSTIRPVRGLQIAGPAEIYLGDEVEFSAMVDERVTEPVEYTWSFGDGRSGVGRRVSHVYANPGTYAVTVTAANPRSQQEEVMEVFVSRRVVPAAITSVTVDDRDPEPGQPVRFVVETTGTDPVNVEWDFGDGSTSDRRITQHAYQEAGEYDVVVRVDNIEVAGEEGADTRRISINVVSPEPELPVLANIHFGINSSYFDDEAEAIMMENVRMLQEFPDVCIEIRGYTDATGSDDYNLWLSDRRANRVKEFYVEQGIQLDRIYTEGVGEAPEPCPGDQDACRENRRVESIAVECR